MLCVCNYLLHVYFRLSRKWFILIRFFKFYLLKCESCDIFEFQFIKTFIQWLFITYVFMMIRMSHDSVVFTSCISCFVVLRRIESRCISCKIALIIAGNKVRFYIAQTLK